MSKPLVGIVVNWVYHFYNHDLNHKLLTFEALFFFLWCLPKFFTTENNAAALLSLEKTLVFRQCWNFTRLVYFTPRETKGLNVFCVLREPRVSMTVPQFGGDLSPLIFASVFVFISIERWHPGPCSSQPWCDNNHRANTTLDMYTQLCTMRTLELRASLVGVRIQKIRAAGCRPLPKHALTTTTKMA